MKRFFTKKVLLMTTVLSLAVSAGSIAYSATTLKKITANQNYAIGIEVGGKKVDLSMDGKKLYPITYEGRTYVPARIVADSLGANVQWDEKRQVVVITPEGQTPPKIDTGSSSTTAPGGSAANSGNKGTINDPIKFNTAFTYKELINYKPEEYDTSSADITVTVKKAVAITRDQIVDYGFQRPEEDPDLEYKLVTLNVNVKNATMKSSGKSSSIGYMYLSSFRPYIWGAQTADGAYVIGGTDYGFDGSMSVAVNEALPDFPKVTPSTKGSSYEVTGNVILPVIKGQENYLVINKSDSTLENNDRKIYFKLQ
ncbi:copper amine oxidase N-terminal domain-containing protein [Paenibacillus sp. 1011MAR3C5]|uniref:copper amine oxidase N-terminal domain-containing protein n=1 Tax=Paenibacillus sp. 1011MAR3C5 TaxID=1675787 RepID=UPI001601EB6B|nr:copper amine oxidase N-terminal domain-containing protein [Paenibacillus sp. 1011MAR3C5]